MYPARAADNGVEGVVVLACQVGDDGAMTRCVVESEDPAGYGFGSATARVFLKYARMKVGEFTPGDWRRFTYKWTLDR